MRTKAVLTLVGGILIHLTLGTLYTASNLASYIISYLHVVKRQEKMDSSMAPWIFALQSLGQAVSMTIGGTIQRVFGIKAALVVGCALVSLSTLGGYWLVDNYYLLCATYGIVFGMGVGIAYSSPMTAAMKWLPNNRGLANGLIVFGFGFGSLIFNFVQTFVINPDNVKPIDDPIGVTKEKFFPVEVVEDMPRVFIIMAICYSVMQLIGILLISEPSEEEQKEIMAENQQLIQGDEAKVEEDGMTTKNAVRKLKFWQIWTTMLCVAMTNTFISSFYKFFGQSFITDDFFLTLVGSISSICNGICRPFWGWANDKFGYKKSMSVMLIIFACFVLTFALSKNGGKWMFMFWVCAMYACIGGAFAVLPTYTDQCFGPKYFGSIYGLVFTSIIISSLVSAFFVTIMVKTIGVAGVSITLGSIIAFSVIITLIPKNWTYRDEPQSPELVKQTLV